MRRDEGNIIIKELAVMFPNLDIQVCVEAVKRNNFDKERAVVWILDNPDFVPKSISPMLKNSDPGPSKGPKYQEELEQVVAIMPHVPDDDIMPLLEKYKGDTSRVIEILMEKFPPPEDDPEEPAQCTIEITPNDEIIEASQDDDDFIDAQENNGEYDVPTEDDLLADWFIHPLLDKEEKDKKEEKEEPPDFMTKYYQEQCDEELARQLQYNDDESYRKYENSVAYQNNTRRRRNCQKPLPVSQAITYVPPVIPPVKPPTIIQNESVNTFLKSLGQRQFYNHNDHISYKVPKKTINKSLLSILQELR